MKYRDGGPAFPAEYNTKGKNYHGPGMSLRDYFAAKAMQSLMPILKHDSNEDNLTRIEAVCEMAYKYADTMLDEREK